MKIELVQDGTGMAYITVCDGLYDSGRNVISGPTSNKKALVQGTFNELLRIISDERKQLSDKHRDGWNEAVNAVAELMESMPVDAEIIKNEFLDG